MPQLHPIAPSRVVQLSGHVSVRGPDGKLHPLHVGDLVLPGQEVVTGPNATVELQVQDTTLPPAAALPEPAPPSSAEPAPAAGTTEEIERAIEAINKPTDPSQLPAAGLTGDGAGDLTPGLRVDRISEPVSPAGLRFPGLDTGRLIEPRPGGEPTGQEAAATGLVAPAGPVANLPTPIGAASGAISASEAGSAVDLGLGAPTGVSNAAVITVNQVPVEGQLLLADGTPVLAGAHLTVAQLTGLQYLPPASDPTHSPAGGFVYTVSDHGATASGTVTIDLGFVPHPPTAQADTASLAENTVALGNVLANDTDPAGSALHVSQYTVGGNTFAAGQVATLAGVGSLVIHADGSYVFTPTTNYVGPVPVATYTASDGSASASSTLTLTVTATPQAPVANPDVASLNENSSASGNVLSNDSDPAGNPLHVSQFSIGGATYTAGSTATIAGVGTLAINADGSYTFDPVAHYAGPVPVATYTATDGTLSATSTLSLTVVDQPPVANPDSATLDENATATGNVLANDADPVGNALHVSQFSIGGATYTAGSTATIAGVGTLAINADGSYTFDPVAHYAGPVPVATYTATDGTLSATSALSLTVVDQPPVANPDSATLDENTTATGNVLTNDTDPVGNALHVSQFSIGGATYTAGSTATIAGVGTLEINADGSYTFDPVAHYAGPVPVATYTATDGTLSATSTLSLNVVDQPPVANPDSATLDENTTATGNVLANDTDPVGNALHVSQFSIGGTTYAAGATATIAGVGTLAINADGSYTFDPVAHYAGPVPVATYTATDGTLSAASTLTLSVTPVDQAPSINLNPDHTHNSVGLQAIGGLYATGVDDSGNAVATGTPDAHYSLLSAPAGSTLTASSTGLWAWYPNDAHSTWIGSVANEPTGIYEYQTSFTLQPGADPASVRLSFDIASDNNLRDILVNGVSTGFTSNLQFHGLTPVQLDGVSSHFVDGTNTITFVVDNRDPGSPVDSGPTGLRVENIAGDVAVIGGDPVNHQTDYATTYVQGTPVSITSADISVQDVDSPLLHSATITLTNQQAGDLLEAGTLPSGISASVNAAGNQIVLTGDASQAAYAAAIHAIDFTNNSASPSDILDRTITVVVNDGFLDSNTATTTVHVVPVHASPTLDLDASTPGTGYSTVYAPGGPAVAIANSDASITDTASSTIHSVTVHIDNFQSGDLLTPGALPSGISAADYDVSAGVLTLSGTASLADYQTAIAGIDFSTTNASTATRQIEVSVNDGIADGNVAISQVGFGSGTGAALGAAAPTATAPAASADHLVVASSNADVFHWTLGDHGAAGSPPTDTIVNFSIADPSKGGDVLDLRDLLQGGASAGAAAGNLQNYLDFDTSSHPGDTIIHVSSTGGFSAGYSAAAEDQRIVLQGVDVRDPAAFGLTATATDNDVIHQLLEHGKLVANGH